MSPTTLNSIRRCVFSSSTPRAGWRRRRSAGPAPSSRLAVHPEARGKGIAEALMWHSFATFRERGAECVDLKTNTVENAAAVRLYERLGMSPVAWEG
nr:GNAT family N-acetyltransferase [Mesorhizobium qingshengii]